MPDIRRPDPSFDAKVDRREKWRVPGGKDLTKILSTVAYQGSRKGKSVQRYGTLNTRSRDSGPRLFVAENGSVAFSLHGSTTSFERSVDVYQTRLQ